APAAATTYGDTIRIQPGITYRYQVRAYKTAASGWDGPYSDIAATATTNIPPSGLVASTVNTTRIDLAWTDNTASETGFVVQRCNGSSCLDTDFSDVGLTAPSAVSWSDTSVCNGSQYTYRIKAVNQGLSLGGFGAWTRRAPIAISDFQPNFQTQVTIPYDVNMKVDFADIRFYDTTANLELPYWIEKIQKDGDGNPISATVWLKTGVFNTVSIYYGNPS